MSKSISLKMDTNVAVPMRDGTFLGTERGSRPIFICCGAGGNRHGGLVQDLR